MNWPDGRTGRTLAGVYLISFVVMLTGLVWTLINQLTGGAGTQLVIGGVLFVAGQVGLNALAFGLRAGVREQTTTARYQRAWHRLTVGLELPAAWRLLAG